MTWVAKFAASDLIFVPRPGMRILYSIALALACQSPAIAQAPAGLSPAPAVTTSPLDASLEAQPPEQSGQAQQLMKEARVELERAADFLDASTGNDDDEALRAAVSALDQFDQSLDQLHQSVPGYVPLELADMLHGQVSSAMQLLQSDRIAAALLMREMALRVTDLTAEADLLIGRVLLGLDDEVLGNISNVLISPKGRIRALIIDRTGAGSTHQFAVDWTAVMVTGTNLRANLSPADAAKLPDYIAQ